MSNIEAVQAMYQAFGHGDVAGVLAHMGDDIAMDDWTGNTAVDSGLLPNMRTRHGRAGAIAFFQDLAEGCDFTRFDVTNLMAGGDQVAATVSLTVRFKATGRTVSDDMIHLWTFDSGHKATRFLHYLDTAKMIAANQPVAVRQPA